MPYTELHPYGIRPIEHTTIHAGGRDPNYIRSMFPGVAIVVHHTAGTDSRAYGENNPRNVSYHLLIGRYAGKIEVHQYGSLLRLAAFHAGFGVLWDPSQNLNGWSIGIEVEGPPFDALLLNRAAYLTACVMDYCRRQNLEAFPIAHKHVDPNKQDPSFSWVGFIRMVGRYLYPRTMPTFDPHPIDGFA